MSKVIWLSIILPLLIIPGCGGSHPVQKKAPLTISPGPSFQDLNIAIREEYKLSSYVWDYAPWVRELESQFNKILRVPEKYLDGEIKGWVSASFTVHKSGVFSEIQVVNHEGPASLSKVVEEALGKLSKFSPWPGNFPQNKLVVSMVVYFPPYRQ